MTRRKRSVALRKPNYGELLLQNTAKQIGISSSSKFTKVLLHTFALSSLLARFSFLDFSPHKTAQQNTSVRKANPYAFRLS